MSATIGRTGERSKPSHLKIAYHAVGGISTSHDTRGENKVMMWR